MVVDRLLNHYYRYKDFGCIENFETGFASQTLAIQFLSSMKIINRIAPFLIVLALGILIFPRVQAVEIADDTLQEPMKNKSAKNYHGIRIYPKLVDELLFSNSNTKPIETPVDAVIYSHSKQLSEESNHSDGLSHEDLQFQEQRYSKNDSDGKCNKSGNSYKR